MQRVCLFTMFVCLAPLSVAAQDSVAITSDSRDLSRPVSTLISQLRQREKVSISYEDPRYVNPADIEDVTSRVAGDRSGATDSGGRRIMVPKGHDVTFVYAPRDSRDPEGARKTIARMLREYTSLGGPSFAAVRNGTRINVVPNKVRDAAGLLADQGSVLDTVISIPAGRRDGGQLLEALCQQVKSQTGYEIGVGPSVPGNYLARYKTSAGIVGEKASTALAELLDHAAPPGSFVWDLYYDPSDRGYILNFAYVGVAGPVSQ
jgi:hypothetical protein